MPVIAQSTGTNKMKAHARRLAMPAPNFYELIDGRCPCPLYIDIEFSTYTAEQPCMHTDAVSAFTV